MSATDTSVIIASKHHGATVPLVVRTAGNLVAILKAYLVEGWAEQPILSCSYDGETGEIVMTFAEEHDYDVDQVVNITGVTPADYNGRWKIASKSTHTIRCPISNVPTSDGADAGAGMFCRLAPAGWSISHINAEETVAIFANGNGRYFLVENEEAVSPGYDMSDPADESKYINVDGYEVYQAARIRAVENVQDLTTFDVICSRTDDNDEFGGFVISCIYQHSSINYDYAYLDGEAISHEVIADAEGFYLITDQYKNQNRMTSGWLYFGQLYDPGQAGKVVLCGLPVTSQDMTSPYTSHTSDLAHFGGGYSGDNRVESDGIDANTGFGFYSGIGAVSGRGPYSFPTPDGKFLYDDKVRAMSAGKVLGFLPGIGCILHNNPLSHWTKFEGVEGVKWLALKVATPGGGTPDSTAEILVNITGPWRD